MAGGVIKKFRCPGRVEITTPVTASQLGKDLHGCWLTIGLKDVNFEKSGRLMCPSCGNTAQERSDKVPTLYSDVHAEFVLDRVSLDTVKAADPAEFLFGACYNPQCSKVYLPSDARGSDALVSGSVSHGGTQFIMARTPKGVKVIDRWRLEGPRHIIAGRPQPGGKPKPKVGQWYRCIFCGSALKMTDIAVESETITNEENDQQWTFPGCAATFRIYRQEEYDALFKSAADGNRVPLLTTG